MEAVVFACTCRPFNGPVKEIIYRNRQEVLPASFVTVSAPSPQHHPRTRKLAVPAAFTAVQRAEGSARTCWKTPKKDMWRNGKDCVLFEWWLLEHQVLTRCYPELLMYSLSPLSKYIKKAAWAVHGIAKVCLHLFWNLYFKLKSTTRIQGKDETFLCIHLQITRQQNIKYSMSYLNLHTLKCKFNSSKNTRMNRTMHCHATKTTPVMKLISQVSVKIYCHRRSPFLSSVCENAWLTQLQTKQEAAWPHFYEPACPESGWKCSVFDVTSTSRRHHSCFLLLLIHSRWRCRADDLQLTLLQESRGFHSLSEAFLCGLATCVCVATLWLPSSVKPPSLMKVSRWNGPPSLWDKLCWLLFPYKHWE